MFLVQYLIVVVLFFGLIPSTWAQTRIQGISLNANEVDRDLTTKTITMSGDVTINYEGQTIIADSATIDLVSQQVEATGSVVFRTEDVYTQAESLSYNYKTKLGSFKKAFIQSGQIVFEGDEIDKVGPKEYLAKNATYTACATCPPAWSFSGSVIEAELGGYAYIKLPVLRVVNIPIFFLPRILVPLKSERQSGLLVPTWGTSKEGGFELGQSYFWAIDRSKDATFTTNIYDKRGVKGQIEYRFVLDKNSKGKLNTAFLSDNVFKKLELPDGTKFPSKRWYFKYKHYFELPNNYINRMNVNLMSDLSYSSDFKEEIDVIGDPALENNISITKNWNDFHASVEGSYYVNLLKDSNNPLDDNQDAVHRFPEIKGSVTRQKLLNTPLYFKVDTVFTNFARKNFSFDNVDENDGSLDGDEFGDPSPTSGGVFDVDTDVLRTGTRIDVIPDFTYPLKFWDRLDVLPRITFRHTGYTFNTDIPANNVNSITQQEYSKSATRQYVQTDLDFKTELWKVFELDSEKDESKTLIQHKIQPSLTYSRIPTKKLDNHVFFGDFKNRRYDQITDPLIELDFYDSDSPQTGLQKFGDGKVQFDYNDRLFELEVVRLGILNKIVRKRIYGTNADYKRIARFEVFQYYDINNEKNAENPKPWTPLNAVLNLNFDNIETYTTTKYYHNANVTDVSSRLKFFNPLRNYLELTYNRTYKIKDDFTADFDATNETVGFGLGYHSKYYSFIGNIAYPLDQSSGDQYKSQEWGYLATLTPPGECWSLSFKQYKNVGDLDIVTDYNISFSFGGEDL